MINRIYKYVALCFLCLPTLTSCMQDDFGKTDDKGVQHCRISVNVMTDLATTHTRSVDMTPGAIVNLNSIWIGVYDVNTGKKLNGNDIIIDMQYRQTATGSKFMDAIEVQFDQDWNSKVCVVGVANFDGMTSKNGNDLDSLKNLLTDADTWEKFAQISVDTESAYADLHGTTTPLLMGYLLNEDDSPLAQVKQSTLGNEYPAISLDHDNSDHIFFTPSEYDSNSDGYVMITDRYLRLRKLVSQINVNVSEGDNISVSNIQFKRMNVPAKVYIAEREMDTGNLANTTSEAEKYSPNAADTDLELYFNDEEWTVANVGQYGFTFQQFENKHWGKSTSYDERVKLNDDGSFAALGVDEKNPNTYASYFVMSMNVVDHSKGISADVEYIIPEGYCSDENGKALYDGSKILNDDIYKDFSCFRNTDYTYNIMVNGVDNIVVNVTSSNNSVHHDDQSGVIWEIKYPDGVSHYDLIPVTGGTFNNFVQFTTNSEGKDADGNEGVCFRLMGLDENNEPIDIFYNVPDEVVTQFTAVWAPTAPHNRFFTTDDPIEQLWEEIPDDLLNAFTIGGMNIIEFIESNPQIGTYSITVGRNQAKGERALYVANKKDFIKGTTDRDGCTTRHILYGAVQHEAE